MASMTPIMGFPLIAEKKRLKAFEIEMTRGSNDLKNVETEAYI